MYFGERPTALAPRGGVQIGRKEDGAPRLLPPD
jgi:hypothetical protein